MHIKENPSGNEKANNNTLQDNTQNMLANNLRNKIIINQTIEWTFWNKKINMEIYPIKWSNKVIINIHWTYWWMYWWNNKYKKLAENLQNEWVWNVIIFETSRKWIERDWTYEKKVEDFKWKTFEEELSDCRSVIKYILDNSKEIFWIPAEQLEITINWNSLWWILALALASEFQQIKNISTVWTGMLTKDKEWLPFLEEYPDNEIINKRVEWFKGNLLLQYWTKDVLFKVEDFQELKWKLKSVKKMWEIKMIWVDHTFKYVNWELSEVPYKQIETNIKALIEWYIPTGEIVPNTEYSPDLEDSDLEFYI